MTLPGTTGAEDTRARRPAGLAWSPDGQYLVHFRTIAGGKRVVEVAGSGPGAKPISLGGYEGPLLAVAVSADGKQIVAGTEDGFVIIWDGKSFKEVARIRVGDAAVRAVAIAPDGRTIAAGVQFARPEDAHRVVLIDTTTNTVGSPLAAGACVRSVAFSPDGRTLAAAFGIDRRDVKPLMTPDEMKAAGGVGIWERTAR